MRPFIHRWHYNADTRAPQLPFFVWRVLPLAASIPFSLHLTKSFKPGVAQSFMSPERAQSFPQRHCHKLSPSDSTAHARTALTSIRRPSASEMLQRSNNVLVCRANMKGPFFYSPVKISDSSLLLLAVSGATFSVVSKRCVATVSPCPFAMTLRFCSTFCAKGRKRAKPWITEEKRKTDDEWVQYTPCQPPLSVCPRRSGRATGRAHRTRSSVHFRPLRAETRLAAAQTTKRQLSP